MKNREFELYVKPKFSYAFLRSQIRNQAKPTKLSLTDQLSLPHSSKSAIQDFPELAAALNAVRKET